MDRYSYLEYTILFDERTLVRLISAQRVLFLALFIVGLENFLCSNQLN